MEVQHSEQLDESRNVLHRLPNEIIRHIFLFLDVASLVGISQASRRLNSVANDPSLWRTYCRRDYHFWSLEHDIDNRIRAPVLSTQWKKLYRCRVEDGRKTMILLEGLLASQMNRIPKFEGMIKKGYDIKDTLITHLFPPVHAEDYLARR